MSVLDVTVDWAKIVCLSNMGIGAIKSSNLSKKYFKVLRDICSCFAPREASIGTSRTSNLSSVLHTTFLAEFMWALEMVKCHFSGKSCENKYQLFPKKIPRH